MIENVHWIALAPLLASVAVLFWGRWLPWKGGSLSIAAAGYGLAHSLALFTQAAKGTLPLPYEASLPWFRYGMFETSLGVLVDGSAVVMLVVVTAVSFLIQVYSLGYMHCGEPEEDPRVKRYYAYLSFFTASMLGLVLADNLLLMFGCWELVGVSSYLLIGFWFEKESAAYAGRKAFLTTKLGDLGFFLGLLLLFKEAGTFGLTQLQSHAARGYISPEAATLIALLLFCGAVGKSAQTPLFIWLPDAMEGPTPVSALIHAATMVAAGVYLVARTYFLFALSPTALEIVAWTGLVTAVLAATMALGTYDIKRILAFSTVSQLGFMMLGLGVGGYNAGLFHLTTHGFFKALLFLGAGSVIHSVHTNDIRQMGGLSSKMPVTFGTMLVATLAIAGIWPLSGYYSKDAILIAAFEHSALLWGLAAAAAMLTSFYMFRMVFLTFRGTPRDKGRYSHAHESPRSMALPLIVLAVPSAFAGLLLQRHHFFESLVRFEGVWAPSASDGTAAHAPEYLIAALSVGLSLVAIAFAHHLYVRDLGLAAGLKTKFQAVFSMLEKRYGFDWLFLKLVDWADALSRACYWFDLQVLDKWIVDGFGVFTLAFSRFQDFLDQVFVDGAVDGFGGLSVDAGRAARAAVRGQVQEYLMYVAIAASLFAALAISR